MTRLLGKILMAIVLLSSVVSHAQWTNMPIDTTNSTYNPDSDGVMSQLWCAVSERWRASKHEANVFEVEGIAVTTNLPAGTNYQGTNITWTMDLNSTNRNFLRSTNINGHTAYFQMSYYSQQNMLKWLWDEMTDGPENMWRDFVNTNHVDDMSNKTFDTWFDLNFTGTSVNEPYPEGFPVDYRASIFYDETIGYTTNIYTNEFGVKTGYAVFNPDDDYVWRGSGEYPDFEPQPLSWVTKELAIAGTNTPTGLGALAMPTAGTNVFVYNKQGDAGLVNYEFWNSLSYPKYTYNSTGAVLASLTCEVYGTIPFVGFTNESGSAYFFRNIPHQTTQVFSASSGSLNTKWTAITNISVTTGVPSNNGDYVVIQYTNGFDTYFPNSYAPYGNAAAATNRYDDIRYLRLRAVNLNDMYNAINPCVWTYAVDSAEPMVFAFAPTNEPQWENADFAFTNLYVWQGVSAVSWTNAISIAQTNLITAVASTSSVPLRYTEGDYNPAGTPTWVATAYATVNRIQYPQLGVGEDYKGYYYLWGRKGSVSGSGDQTNIFHNQGVTILEEDRHNFFGTNFWKTAPNTNWSPRIGTTNIPTSWPNDPQNYTNAIGVGYSSLGYRIDKNYQIMMFEWDFSYP